MTEEELQALIQRHGGLIGTTALNPTVKTLDPKYGDLTGKEIEGPNPNPIYRYTLADGSHFTARKNPDASQQAGAPVYDVVDPGTTVKQPTPKTPTPTTLGPTHAGESVTDPATGEVVGFYDQTGRFVPTRRAPAGPAPEAPGMAAERAARTHLYGLQAQEAQQKLLPAQQLLIENHFKTIDALQNMLAQGQLSPQEANSYMQEMKGSLEAALQGTTPFQQEQAQQQKRSGEMALGGQLINQRLQSGHALASSLLSSAASLADRAMLQPGQSFGLNPLKLAMAFTNQLGGGDAVNQLAQSLLMGANPRNGPAGNGVDLGQGNPTAIAPGVASPESNPTGPLETVPIGGNGPIAGDFPMTRSEVIAKYPELGRQNGPQAA